MDIKFYLAIAKRNRKADIVEAIAIVEEKKLELEGLKNDRGVFSSKEARFEYAQCGIVLKELNKALQRVNTLELLKAKNKQIERQRNKIIEEKAEMRILKDSIKFTMQSGLAIARQASAQKHYKIQEKEEREIEKQYADSLRRNPDFIQAAQAMQANTSTDLFGTSAEAFKVEFLPETTPLAEEKSEKEKNKDVYKALGIEADVVEAKTKEVIEIAKKTPELAELPLKEVGDRLMEAFLRSKA